jgi:phage-related protein
MPAALPLQTAISESSQNKTSYKIIEVKYGNGYSQRAGDGYNSIQQSWTITWGVITSGELSTVVTALDTANGSDYLTWQSPVDASSKKWVCKDRTVSAMSGSLYEVSATLEQVFDL